MRPAAAVRGPHPALPDIDGEVDELAVLDNEVFQSFWLQELLRILLHEQAMAGGGRREARGRGREVSR